MPWSSLANNQTISRANLQDAINLGYFSAKTSFPADSLQVSKSLANTYINIPNASWFPYSSKDNSQLITKYDLPTTVNNNGSFILDAQYGVTFTSMSGTGLPDFGFPTPVTTGNETRSFNYNIPAQTISFGLGGNFNVYPSNIAMYLDSALISSQQITSLPDTKYFTIPAINAPSTIRFAINTGSTPPPSSFTFQLKDVNNVLVSKTNGVYMLVTTGSYTQNPNYSGYFSGTQGYLYVSSNTGSSFTNTGLYGYWTSVSASDSGQYMLATQYNGYCYTSTNYGASWSQVSSLGVKGFLSGCTFNNGYMMVVTDTPSGGKVYRTTNNGSTWSEITAYTGTGTPGWGEISCASASGYVMLSSQGWGVYKSSDYGASFSLIPSNIVGDGGYYSLSYSSDGSYFAMIKSQFKDTSTSYIVSSVNQGSSFQTMSSSILNSPDIWSSIGISNYSSSIAINPNSVYPKRITNFSSVSNITSVSNSGWTVADQSNGGSVILLGAKGTSTSYGLYKSTNGGTSFQPV